MAKKLKFKPWVLENINVPINMFQIQNSSQIESVGCYMVEKEEPEEDITNLIVKFHAGGVYIYYDVPFNKIVELRNAESAGKYLNSEIKGKFTFQKLV